MCVLCDGDTGCTYYQAMLIGVDFLIYMSSWRKKRVHIIGPLPQLVVDACVANLYAEVAFCAGRKEQGANSGVPNA